MDVRAKPVQKLSVSNIHSGIVCDKCATDPIEGFRYACLVCEDYDLCTECYQKKSTSEDHRAFHPMLPILAPDDLAKALKNLTPSQVKIFSCPYCGDGDFAIGKLAAHCLEYHSYKGGKVRCPICVTFSVPDKKCWIAEDTLLLHLLMNHQNKDGYGKLILNFLKILLNFSNSFRPERQRMFCVRWTNIRWRKQTACLWSRFPRQLYKPMAAEQKHLSHVSKGCRQQQEPDDGFGFGWSSRNWILAA